MITFDIKKRNKLILKPEVTTWTENVSTTNEEGKEGWNVTETEGRDVK